MPGIAAGAGFGSLGIRNIPHKAAATIGKPATPAYRHAPFKCQPQQPNVMSIAISNKNRAARFIGLVFIQTSYIFCSALK
jgi:hypothetical protein